MRKKLEENIKNILKEKFEQDFDIKLDVPAKQEHGDFALPCFTFSKLFKKAPNIIAEEIRQFILEKNIDFIDEITPIGPYLNFKLKKSSYFNKVINDILASNENYGKSTLNENKKIMVEFSSPNTNKPLHLGHIRNNILGDAISNILAFSGYKVIRSNLLNDRGIHICKSIVAWLKFGNGETPESSNLKGDHFVGKYYVIFEKKLKEELDNFVKEKNVNLSELEEREKDKFMEEEFYPNSELMKQAREMLVKWENSDEETIKNWKLMNSWVITGFKQSYEDLGIKFDKYYFESETYKLGKEYALQGIEKEVCYQKEDGSVWVKLPEKKFGNDKLLLRKDGTSVYMTQDIGTTFLKFKDFNLDKAVWVVGSEQEYHFQVLFKIMELLGLTNSESCYHLSYGMIYLPEGKMKSREGKVVDADDLVLEMKEKAQEEIIKRNRPFSEKELKTISNIVGLGALKYYILQYSAKTDFVFDPNASIDFNGKTGPYIQYTHARISSLIKTIGELNLEAVDYSYLKNKEDFELLKLLEQLPQVISKSAETYNTSFIAEYLYNLASSFNSFYSKADNKIKDMNTEEQKPRLAIAKACKIVLSNALNLFGITAPEQM
ncbi:MAG: arginine--tRNA ligase [Candidatus Sericytochromatia bacterium]